MPDRASTGTLKGTPPSPPRSVDGEQPQLSKLLTTVRQRKRMREKAATRIELTSAHTRKQLELVNRYLRLLRRAADQQSYVPLAERLNNIRRLVITEGLPEEGLEHRLTLKRRWAHQCSLRGLIWKVLLGTYHVDALLYMRLLEMGASTVDWKIRDDLFRTFKNVERFQARVSKDQMARILNAFVRLNHPDEGLGSASDIDVSETMRDSPSRASATKPVMSKYIQGMNVLCGILLYVMPEVDAYFTFNSLVTRHCPGYITPNLDGVHVGVHLVDRCLEMFDPVLHGYLKTKNVTAKVFAFPLLLSLFGCCPPIEQVLLVWDVLFAYGVHLVVPMCVAQVLIMRDTLLQDPTPIMSLRPDKPPPIDAQLLLAVAFEVLSLLPEDLYNEVVLHPFVVDRHVKIRPPQSPVRAHSEALFGDESKP